MTDESASRLRKSYLEPVAPVPTLEEVIHQQEHAQRLLVWSDPLARRGVIEERHYRLVEERQMKRVPKVAIMFPRELLARDVSASVSTDADSLRSTHMEDDAEAFDLRFFVLQIQFGIDPAPKRKVGSVDAKVTLIPACFPKNRCIRTYKLVPDKAWKGTAVFDGTIEADANLGFGLPKGITPILNAGVSATAKGSYSVHVQYATATVNASSNGNEEMSWQFQADPTLGQDPRGMFHLAATVGVPRSYGTTKQELEKRMSATLRLNAEVDGWFFDHPVAKSGPVPIRFGSN